MNASSLPMFIIAETNNVNVYIQRIDRSKRAPGPLYILNGQRFAK